MDMILYQGPSLLDGSPIVVIATLNSGNSKTGNMVQTWIIRSDIDPMQAVWGGKDNAICGDCIHRGDGTGKGRSCYVLPGQAPTNIYKKYKAGKYPNANLNLLRWRMVRIGSYGDPAAVPISVWESIANIASGYTGYTHQWRNCDPAYARYCMASVETESQAEQARNMGYRTFRVRSASDRVVPGLEFVCPASTEAGKRIGCDACRACNGRKNMADKRGSVVIIGHGGQAVQSNLNKKYAQLTISAT